MHLYNYTKLYIDDVQVYLLWKGSPKIRNPTYCNNIVFVYHRMNKTSHSLEKNMTKTGEN